MANGDKIVNVTRMPSGNGKLYRVIVVTFVDVERVANKVVALLRKSGFDIQITQNGTHIWASHRMPMSEINILIAELDAIGTPNGCQLIVHI